MKYKVGDLLECAHSCRLYYIYDIKCETYYFMDIGAANTLVWGTLSAEDERFYKKVN